MNKYLILTGFLFLNTAMVMSQKYETQEYEVVDQIDKIEIRYYPSAPMIRVSSNQSRNNNFGKLFRYIAGNNIDEEKIAMTTPVYMSEENKTMEFVLPKRFLSGDIPAPNDNDVVAYISEPKYYAAIKYSGYSNNKKEENHREELVKTIQNSNLKILSEYFVLSYDAPTKFYNRRNEILIQVDYSN
tara:strand:- start:1184 stop:1741 length:558 start_codon:yes stop_codon:yes gene_type:complete